MTPTQEKLLRFLSDNFKAQMPGSDYFLANGGIGLDDVAAAGFNPNTVIADLTALKDAGLITLTTRKDGNTGVRAEKAIFNEIATIDAAIYAQAEQEVQAKQVEEYSAEVAQHLAEFPKHANFGAFVAEIINKARVDGLL